MNIEIDEIPTSYKANSGNLGSPIILGSDEEIFLDPNQPIKLSLTFTQLREGEWLTDTEINEFLKLLRKQFPEVYGLEDPLILKHYDIVKYPEYIRILLSRKNHWICIAGGIVPDNEEIFVFDSMERTKIDKNLGKVILKMYDNKKLLTFNIRNVQKQEQSLCGYFSLAFATALCYGKDPENLVFNPSNLIEHYIACITEKKVKEFPHEIIQNINKKENKIIFFDADT